MHLMYEQLVNDRIQQLHDEAEAARLVRRARHEGQPSRAARILRRLSQGSRRPTLARTSPAPTLDTTTSTT